MTLPIPPTPKCISVKRVPVLLLLLCSVPLPLSPRNCILTWFLLRVAVSLPLSFLCQVDECCQSRSSPNSSGSMEEISFHLGKNNTTGELFLPPCFSLFFNHVKKNFLIIVAFNFSQRSSEV